ncbi:DUF3426 domain-containing protein [Stenotrophomonas sp.]|uniref:DUF3426 domain-containing protein n=1 Tax=Stenotrophomonas sp. TaxID=69392 RepID=UPI002FCAB3E3
MTEPTPPPRRPLATFLRPGPADASAHDPTADAPSPVIDHDGAPSSDAAALPPVTVGKDWTQAISVFDPPVDERETVHAADDADTAWPQRDPAPEADGADLDVQPATAHAAEVSADTASWDAALDPEAAAAAPANAAHAAAPARSGSAPSFMRLPTARLRTPRWQWAVLAGLVLLLAVQIAVADRARLAADAGSRPWIAGVCSVLRCALPAWQEPAAFSMISRDVRPVPGQPGALQVQASFRNDARWAQAWPSLRLSLSDADGRVIGTGVFAPRDYLDRSLDASSVLEPGQSAQIAFRVREPAASTVAFTFEFL